MDSYALFFTQSSALFFLIFHKLAQTQQTLQGRTVAIMFVNSCDVLDFIGI